MKLTDVIILSLAIVFIFIGLYESIRFGIGTGYWAVMLAILLLFVFSYRKRTVK